MRSPWFILALLNLACTLPADVDDPDPTIPPPPVVGEGMRLLFVGNSLTYTYNVPQLVGQLAVAAGKPTPTLVARTAADYALEDHWAEGQVQRDLRDGDYDVMILQQGPSTLTSSGDNLTQWVRTFATAAAAVGTRVGVYAISAPVGADYEAGVEHYRTAADVSGTGFYPSSQAWQLAWELNEAMPLYAGDKFHPSRHGATLSAMVIAALIFEIDPTTMPNLFPSVISDAEAAQLRRAAELAVQIYGRR
ncbi:MAG: hypothetical protein IPP98_10785 [Gemmatimonadetes bacterium]|nr:hypothetical protein [Gemmatimonadota bacterium]